MKPWDIESWKVKIMMPTKKSKIKTTFEKRNDDAMLEYMAMKNTILELDKRQVDMNKALNTALVVLDSLLKVLSDNKVIKQTDVEKASRKTILAMEEKNKKEIQDAKESIIDGLMNSDISANA